MCGGIAALVGFRRAPEYQIARGAGYALIGGIAGASGEGLFRLFTDRPEWTLGLLFAFLIAILFQSIRIWNGTADTGWSVQVPRAILGRLGRRWPNTVARSGGPMGYGFLSAFVPCGWFAYFGWIAASTGSAAMGALVFTMLWLGSLPALLTAAATWSAVRRRYPGSTFRRASAIILLVASILSFIPRFAAFERSARADSRSTFCGEPLRIKDRDEK